MMKDLIQLLQTAAQAGGKKTKGSVVLQVEHDLKGICKLEAVKYLPEGKYANKTIQIDQDVWVFQIASGNLDGSIATLNLNGALTHPSGVYHNIVASTDGFKTSTVVGFVQEPGVEQSVSSVATPVELDKPARKQKAKAGPAEPAQTPAGAIVTTLAPATQPTISLSSAPVLKPTFVQPVTTEKVAKPKPVIKNTGSIGKTALRPEVELNAAPAKPRPPIVYTPAAPAPQVQQPKARINRDVVEPTTLDQLIYPETREDWSGRRGRGVGLRQHCAILVGLAQELLSLHARGIYVGFLRPRDIQFSFTSVSKLEVKVEIWMPDNAKNGLLSPVNEINEQYMHPVVLNALKSGDTSAETMSKADWFAFGQIAFMLLLGVDPFLTGEVKDKAKSEDRIHRMEQGLWLTRLGKVKLEDDDKKFFNDVLDRVVTIRDEAIKGLSLKTNEAMLGHVLRPEYLQTLKRCYAHRGMKKRDSKCIAMLESRSGSCMRCKESWKVTKLITTTL